MATKADEVAWGESQEAGVLGRWLQLQQGASKANGWRAIKSRKFQDWDFLILNGAGLPYAYVEIKVRRTLFVRFGDAIAPIRKHDLARKLHAAHGIRFLMVVCYPDALVEIDLAERPAKIDHIERRDRPGLTIEHGFWSREQIKVVD